MAAKGANSSKLPLPGSKAKTTWTLSKSPKKRKREGAKGQAGGKAPLPKSPLGKKPPASRGDDDDDDDDDDYTEETIDDCGETTEEEDTDDDDDEEEADGLPAAEVDAAVERRLSGTEIVDELVSALGGMDTFKAWAPSGNGPDLATHYVVDTKCGELVSAVSPLPKTNRAYFEATCTETNDVYRAVGVKAATGDAVTYHVVLDDKIVHKHLMPDGAKGRVTMKKYLANGNIKTDLERVMYAPPGSMIYSTKLARETKDGKRTGGASAKRQKLVPAPAAPAAAPAAAAAVPPSALAQLAVPISPGGDGCAVDPSTETAVRLPVTGGHVTLRFSFVPTPH